MSRGKLYRFLIIWQYNWLAFVIPCLMYLTSVGESILHISSSLPIYSIKAFSILLLVQLSTSGLDINASTNQNVGIIFWSLSIAVNLLLTALIVGRLAWVGKLIGRA